MPRWLAIGFAALLLNSAYLWAFADPTLWYFLNVAAYPVLGLALAGAISAGPHTLGLTLPTSTQPRVLLLTGWTDYAFSSDSVAAHQAGLALEPPRFEMKNTDGTWRTLVSNIGVPVGRPQTIVVDQGNS